ncbi:hypothetical protein RHABOEDO_001359 [Candidatus Rhabdochlamydia oedothoracis]|uniref:Uncharacterized protein n=1 Tax=Candidatus Rhabdochlamydia oedothoracis TaxID=2720720 RepID=A0ABX8V1J6_9BACT|nr:MULTISPECIES: hypothetical protein [Rhabdochlamydia]KAG6559412.1 hypothetical protein RHOW815_000587 [Candidatus Rhabdochlamydia sp. W815]MCL6756408.1 hypothetical protein [Candidatus Rhabdochlamydia oedothoracis]QYF49093.1 hypothetical protein RHABOEDO_001359 [Candidatus Rhabdochlamydia oedothoracis]
MLLWLICFLCISLTVCAEDKKKPRPRQAQPHFVGVGRPKNQMTKKKQSPTDKYFLSKTPLKKRKQKKIAKKTENQEERPFYQKPTDVDKSLIVK